MDISVSTDTFRESFPSGRRDIARAIGEVRRERLSEFDEELRRNDDRAVNVIVVSEDGLRQSWLSAVSERATTAGPSMKGWLLAISLASTVTAVELARHVFGSPVPPLPAAMATCGLALWLLLVLVHFVWFTQAVADTPAAVARSFLTGHFPWMAREVVLPARRMWVVGVRGVYVPREPREFYEPYSNFHAWADFTTVGYMQDGGGRITATVTTPIGDRELVFSSPICVDGNPVDQVVDEIASHIRRCAERG